MRRLPANTWVTVAAAVGTRIVAVKIDTMIIATVVIVTATATVMAITAATTGRIVSMIGTGTMAETETGATAEVLPPVAVTLQITEGAGAIPGARLVEVALLVSGTLTRLPLVPCLLTENLVGKEFSAVVLAYVLCGTIPCESPPVLMVKE